MANMSSPEFALLQAYDRVEPFGPQRDDLRMGIALASYHNSQSPDNRSRPIDFMPFAPERDEDEDEGPKQTVEEQIEIMMRLTEHQNRLVAAGGGY